MSGLILDYDRSKGKLHNLESILNDLLPFMNPIFLNENVIAYWAKVLAFDTLIANTDRHQDNWGLIASYVKSDQLEMKFSPAFDNGTALEYLVQEKNFNAYNQQNKLEAYLMNPKYATHHMKWTLNDEEPLNFYQFMAKFVLNYPDVKDLILGCLNFNRHLAEEILEPLCVIVDDEKYQLTHRRLEFILDMIFRRKHLLQEALG